MSIVIYILNIYRMKDLTYMDSQRRHISEILYHQSHQHHSVVLSVFRLTKYIVFPVSDWLHHRLPNTVPTHPMSPKRHRL